MFERDGDVPTSVTASQTDGTVQSKAKRWWRYAVLRGDGIPASLDGRWYDLDDLHGYFPPPGYYATMEATNRWEQREDGEVAVVYEWVAAHTGRADG